MKKLIWLAAFAGLLSCSSGPEPPTLIQPEEGPALLADMPFTWSSVQNASRYMIEFAADPSFITLITNLTTETSDTTYSLAVDDYQYFQAGITYYWRVYSGNSRNWGTPSASRSFVILGGKG